MSETVVPRLQRVLYPQSIAVVGASRDSAKRGHHAIRQLLDDGYGHPVYPIHPTNREVLGLRCYPRVADIPDRVDLAFVAVPRDHVVDAIHECGEEGIAGAVVIANGFSEVGSGGRQRERALTAAAERTGILVIGPNTNGVFNLHHRMNLVGSGVELPVGRLAVITQSGNVGLSIANEAASVNAFGVGIYVGLGNQSGLEFHDLLSFLRVDPNTDAIAIYAEGIRNGRAFLAEIARTMKVKPVVVMKAGRTSQGARSARSHTGAISADPTVTASLLEQAGAVVVDRSDEIFPVVSTLGALPQAEGDGVAVLSDGGGHATIAVDALVTAGMRLARLTKRTRNGLAKILPSETSVSNPVDVGGATDTNPGLFTDCLEVLLEDRAVKAVLVLGLLGGYGDRFSDPALVELENQVAHGIVQQVNRSGKPVVVQSAYAFGPKKTFDVLRQGGVPVHSSVEMAVRVVAALGQAARAKRRPLVARVASVPGRQRSLLPEHESRRELASAGITFPTWLVAHSKTAAGRALTVVGRPAVVKGIMEGVSHKAEAGGVHLALSTTQEVERAYESLEMAAEQTGRTLHGAIVEEMVGPGLEMIVGAIRDATYGPLLMIGRGGSEVELHRDVMWRALPLRMSEIREMIANLECWPLFRGFRGAPALDLESLCNVAAVAGKLILDRPDTQELELNPVIVRARGCIAVDVKASVNEFYVKPEQRTEAQNGS